MRLLLLHDDVTASRDPTHTHAVVAVADPAMHGTALWSLSHGLDVADVRHGIVSHSEFNAPLRITVGIMQRRLASTKLPCGKKTDDMHCQKNRVEWGRKLFPRVDIVRVRVEISYLQLFNPSKGRFSYPGL